MRMWLAMIAANGSALAAHAQLPAPADCPQKLEGLAPEEKANLRWWFIYQYGDPLLTIAAYLDEPGGAVDPGFFEDFFGVGPSLTSGRLYIDPKLDEVSEAVSSLFVSAESWRDSDIGQAFVRRPGFGIATYLHARRIVAGLRENLGRRRGQKVRHLMRMVKLVEEMIGENLRDLERLAAKEHPNERQAAGKSG